MRFFNPRISARRKHVAHNRLDISASVGRCLYMPDDAGGVLRHALFHSFLRRMSVIHSTRPLSMVRPLYFYSQGLSIFNSSRIISTYVYQYCLLAFASSCHSLSAQWLLLLTASCLLNIRWAVLYISLALISDIDAGKLARNHFLRRRTCSFLKKASTTIKRY